jgi:hypothetical protein
MVINYCIINQTVEVKIIIEEELICGHIIYYMSDRTSYEKSQITIPEKRESLHDLVYKQSSKYTIKEREQIINNYVKFVFGEESKKRRLEWLDENFPKK